MNISKNSQLGLMASDISGKISLLTTLEECLKHQVRKLNGAINIIESGAEIPEQDSELYKINNVRGGSSINRFEEDNGLIIEDLIDSNIGEAYLITNGVLYPSEMIRIGEGFNTKTLSDIKFGTYTYLMGKHKTSKFMVFHEGIYGYYWDNEKSIAFTFSIDTTKDEIIFPILFRDEFSNLIQIMTFVELGDIEVIELKSGRNNGKPKKDGKVTNTSEFTVFVVDSSWNKLIIRSDGFCVRGHFKLQPYGENLSKRKLIWVNSFKKLGYTRKPKALIRDAVCK